MESSPGQMSPEDRQAGPSSFRFDTPAPEDEEPLDLMAPEPSPCLDGESAAALIQAGSALLPALPPPLPHPSASAPATPETAGGESGLGLVLGGTGLIVLGIYLACLLPTQWLSMEGAEDWIRQKTAAGLVLYGAGALSALTLGAGSLLQRRWAPPLIHAAGWIAALTASGIIAVAGFFLVGSEAETPLPGMESLLLLVAALGVPLLYIFYYQQESVTTVCEAADPAPSWTDTLPVPALMVFLSGLGIAAGAAAMLRHQPAMPLPPDQLLTGPAATAAWCVLGGLGLGTALCVWLRKSAAVWLLLLAAVALAVMISPPALPGGVLWDKFLTALGHPPAAGPDAPLVPLLAALLPAPLILIFAMERRAFSSPPPP